MRHEWVEAPALDTTLRIKASLREGSVALTTPQIPNREPFSLNLYLKKTDREVSVTLNGRPVFTGRVKEDVAGALLAARYALQTGRAAEGVLRVRP